MGLARDKNSRRLPDMKHGRTKIITAAKLLSTNQVVLIINCSPLPSCPLSLVGTAIKHDFI